VSSEICHVGHHGESCSSAIAKELEREQKNKGQYTSVVLAGLPLL